MLVDPALFGAVQEQLEENILQGLLVCAKCGYAYHGRTNDTRNAYYRCSGAMSLPRFDGQRWCWNKELRMDQTDVAVWQEVCRLLEEPERLEQEYRRRLLPPQKPNEHEGLETQMGKLRRGIARLIDSYADGLIDKQEFEPRVTRMRERMQHLEEQIQHLKEEVEVEGELRLILGQLETFAAKVNAGLQNADETVPNKPQAGWHHLHQRIGHQNQRACGRSHILAAFVKYIPATPHCPSEPGVLGSASQAKT